MSPQGSIPLRERRALADEWREFAETVVPKNAPEVQHIETRRAFYSGAQIMFALISGGLDEDHEPTDLDVAYVESLSQELAAFIRDLRDGKA